MFPFGLSVGKVGKMREKKDLSGLAKALASKDALVSIAAAEALESLAGDIQDASVIEALISYVNDDSLGGYAIRALTAIGDKRAADSLLPLLSGQRRGLAARALGAMHDTRAFEQIMTLLADGSDDVRSDAAVALGLLGDKRAADALYGAATQDSDWLVRESAGEALVKLGDPRGADAYVSSAVTRLIETYNTTGGEWFESDGGKKSALPDVLQGRVRRIGEQLNSLGGLALMEEAYGAFTDYADWGWKITHDLRKVWAGIGEWKA